MIKNKNLVFLELNSSYSHSMLSYCLIRSLAEREAPSWNWMHTTATIKTPVEDIVLDVESCKPDILLATAYIFNLELLCEVCECLKAHNKNLHIYLGGPCFLGDNEEFLRANPAVTGVIRGDESSIPDLLQGMEAERIAGLCRIDENGIYRDNSLLIMQTNLIHYLRLIRKEKFIAAKPFINLRPVVVVEALVHFVPALRVMA